MTRIRAVVFVLVISLVAQACGSDAPGSGVIDLTDTTTTTAPPEAAPDNGATSTTAATTSADPAESGTGDIDVRTGAAVLVDAGFGPLHGRRVGLIAHQNSTVDGVHLADLLDADPRVELAALFGPEHGIRGVADAGELVGDETDPATGAPIFSLYGDTRTPTTEMLEGVDVLVYDLQDVGTRYYTYISTMGLAMQAAARAGIPFVVLDRPNPQGDRVGGSLLRSGFESFVGQYPIPDVYGLTSGELALAIVGEAWLEDVASLDLTVITMDGWEERPTWGATTLSWTPPSPAMTNPDAALLYPATVLFEATDMSLGRGTDRPFEVIGAPWLDVAALVERMEGLGLAGVAFDAIEITPRMLDGMTIAPAHLDETIPAISLRVTDADTIDAVRLGIELLEGVVETANGRTVVTRPEWLGLLTGSDALAAAIGDPVAVATLLEAQAAEAEAFRSATEPYRRYPREDGDPAQLAPELFPDIIDATAALAEDGTWRISATVSSPYDTPERYADAWRVLAGPMGESGVEAEDGSRSVPVELAVRELLHDHQNEQPFTRSLDGVSIPDDVDVITVQGRDQVSGWGGQMFEITLTR